MTDVCNVRYEVYPAAECSTDSSLDDFLAQCLTVLQPLTANYIWQRDALHLVPSTVHPQPWQAPSSSALSSQQACLWGSSCIGESVEDEWLITSLLRAVTSALPCTARVWDDDGEFVLIEAAYSLPRWLNPDTATNRIWWHGGTLHIVPRQSAQHPTLPLTPSVEQALVIVRGDVVASAASARVMATLDRRMTGLPQDAMRMLNHTAHVLIPPRLAALLEATPQLVADASTAFHYRDVDAMMAFAQHRVFGMPSNAQDLVMASVRFNRVQYAQLAMQRFEAPKRYPMPAADSPHYHAAVLGLKLVAGVEMVLADAAAQGGDDDDAAAASRCDGPRWKAFVASLTKMGYFQEQLPGSALYNSLLQQAQAAFATDATVLHLNAATPLSPASKTTSLARHQLRSLGDVDADTWRVQHPVLPPADNDTWMRDGGPELDAELARRQAERDTHQQPAQQGASVEDVAGRIGTFMEGHGGVDGAQVPDALDKAVDVSMDVVLRELSAALGVPLGKAGNEGGGAVGVDDDVEDDDGESADEGSSFFSDPPTSDEDGDDDDVQQEEEGAGPSQGGFFQSYMEALEEQLHGTTLDKTFQDAPTQTTQGHENKSDDVAVDVDLNLVQSLLASVDVQQGMAGPASNLAGMVGLNLHHQRGDKPQR